MANDIKHIDNDLLTPVSLLRKSYEYINDVLKRNIGTIDYQQHIKNIDDILIGQEKIGDVISIYPNSNNTLLHFISPIRLKYENYYDYAKQLNEKNAYKGLFKDFEKNVVDYNILRIDTKEYGMIFPNEENLTNPLLDISEQYISYVDELIVEKQSNGIIFGVELDNMTRIPHQLTQGYDYDTFYKTTYPKISAKDDITTALFDKVSLNFVQTGYYDFSNISLDNVRQDMSNISHTSFGGYINSAINYQKSGIKNKYGKLLKEGVKYNRLFHNGKNEFATLDFDSNKLFNDVSSRVYAEAYNETDVSSFNQNIKKPLNNQNKKSYLTLNETTQHDDLVNYTNQNFRKGKIKTLISRFGSMAEGNGAKDKVQTEEYDYYHTAVSSYGTSHGRNLLKSTNKRQMKYGAYNDPYCRVWTTHHQYSSFNNLIRPFAENDEIIDANTLYGKHGFFNVRRPETNGFDNGLKRLQKNGVLDVHTNLVRITPNTESTETRQDQIKKCMFSIENLAWKGIQEDFLSEEQRGPLGGRIMWFPPYDIKFSESISSQWNPTKFIGRGEPVYTYTDTERSGQLSFKILIDHPSIVNWYVTNDSSNKGDQWTQDGEEYDLLRFFAGCDIPLPYNKDENPLLNKPKQEEEVKPIVEKDDPKEDDIVEEIVDTVEEDAPTNDTEKIIFMVFFPNNYSGNYENGTVDPIVYLMNGIGAQKWNPKASGVEGQNDYQDLPTDEDYPFYGYEILIKTDNGITPFLVTDETKSNKACPSCKFDSLVLVPQKNTKHQLPTDDEKYTAWDWWYRVDEVERTSGQWLRPRIAGHSDQRSFGLNSQMGLSNVINAASSFNISDDEIDYLYSLTDVFVALKEKTNKPTALTNTLKFGTFANDTKVEEILNKLENYKVQSVEACGMASSHGASVKGSNQQLMNDRASTIIKWLQTMFNDNDIEYKNTTKSGLTIEESEQNTYKTSDTYGQKKDESELLAKLGRCAKVVIELKRDVTKNIQNTLESEEESSTKVLIENEIKEKVTSDTRMFNGETSTSTETLDTSNRYDDEYKFFHELALTDPILRHEISEKVKYFDPAFHAITPEGFNARLTFLQQCTRQGPTIGNSQGGTANNLAFGRQPVCVLRIGDFYNTKIIIESMSIDYGNQQWDLNPEGIGVQPMYADISISFKFLGGSDLTGPIGRLQNAVSFNYYANTSVYDDRSEMIEYKNKDISNYKSFDVDKTNK